MATLFFHSGSSRSIASTFRNIVQNSKVTIRARRAIGVSMVSAVVMYHFQRSEAQCDSYTGGNGKSSRGSGSRKSDKGGAGGEDGEPDAVENFITACGPTISKLGFGGLMGICTAACVKRVSREAAYVVGMGFVFLQGMAYLGYVDVNYIKMADDIQNVVDADGDGKLSASDFIIYWKKVKKVLKYNLPGFGGFSSGFIIGMRFM